MKNIFLILLAFLFSSCSSTKYSAGRDHRNFDQLTAGKTYVFFHQNDLKTKMEITSIEKDSILGLKNKERIALGKNTIWKVKKNNTAGTVILVGTAVGLITLTAVLSKALLDIGRAFAPPP